MSKLVLDGTPWEEYQIDGVFVYIKREDLCCPLPGPSFSKIRGIERYITKQPQDATFGVMDTRHSKAGWGVAYICKEYGYNCVDYYPVLKSDNGKLRENQQRAEDLGAMLYPMKAGMSAVLFNQAKTITKEIGGIMLPNGLHLQESVDATADELIKYTPEELLDGTWVVSISSGTLGAGIVMGLDRASHNEVDIIYHMGYSRSEQTVRKWTKQVTDDANIDKLSVIDEGYEYADKVDNSWIPFPCNEYYDAKAFTWLAHNVHNLRQPIIFWNIGA